MLGWSLCTQLRIHFWTLAGESVRSAKHYPLATIAITTGGLMRQLTASEASNDEMERGEFERTMKLSRKGNLFDFTLKEGGSEYRSGATRILFSSWQAALKSKQGEV